MARRAPPPKDIQKAAKELGIREMTDFQRGYLAGYDDGLAECGPLTGVTRFFDRRGKRKKIAKKHADEARRALNEALQELESQRKSGRAALPNPGSPRPAPRASGPSREAWSAGRWAPRRAATWGSRSRTRARHARRPALAPRRRPPGRPKRPSQTPVAWSAAL